MSYLWKISDLTSQSNTLDDEQSKPKVDEKETTGVSMLDAKEQTNSANKTKVNKKKRKKHREEKEEGELDDENESMEESNREEIHTYEDDDYEDYDMDEDSKTSHDDLKKSETNIIEIEHKLDTCVPSLSLVKSSVSDTGLTTSEIVPKILTTSTEIPFNSTPQALVLASNTHYEMEEDDDDDDDDDDYGNSKRLKIDESDMNEDKVIENKPTECSIEKAEEKEKIQSNDQEINKEKDEIKESIDCISKKPDLPSSTEADPVTKSENTQMFTGNKPFDLDNDNDSSSSMSSKSSSSVLTAISTISSDSLPISSTASTNSNSKPPNDSVQQQQESNPEINVDSSSDNKPIEIDEEQMKAAAENLINESLKVPPLKIIYSNSLGGHPYVKTDPNENNKNRKKDRNAAKKEQNDPETPVKPEDESKETKPTIKIDTDTPANNSRSKSSKTSNRVASPITTPSAKTTPTRRSAALAGRSSPAQNLMTSAQNKKYDQNTANAQNTSDSANSGNGSNLANSNEMENVIRRKLRSHTRQLQTGDTFESVSRPLSITTKSPSPLTVLNENANSSNNTETNTADQHIEPKSTTQQGEATKGSDHSNDSLIDSSDSMTNSTNQESTQPTRKKRSRQQQQNENSSSNDLEVSNSAPLNQANNASVVSGNEAIQSSNSSLDSAASITTINDQSANALTNSNNTQQPSTVYNCIKKFLDLRVEINRKRDGLMETHFEIKLPNNYQDFLVFKKNYLIKSNKEVRQSILFFKPPIDMPDDLKEFFFKQEKERHSLRLRHRIEQDKLIILYEQEILRCFNNKSSKENSSNQTVPYSFCSIVKDDEVYSSFGRLNEQIVAQQQNQTDECFVVQPTSDERFLQNLEQLKTKFQKLKDDLVKRQLNESDSLHAVQKMDFQSCVRELLNKYKTSATKNSTNTNGNSSASLSNYNLISQFQQTNITNCVPIVNVNFNKIDLFEVSQIYSPVNSTSLQPSNTVTVSS